MTRREASAADVISCLDHKNVVDSVLFQALGGTEACPARTDDDCVKDAVGALYLVDHIEM